MDNRHAGWYYCRNFGKNFSVLYQITYSLFYLFSLLPFWVLYGISDVGFVLLYHLVGYRKSVVRENLLLSFPDKTAEERLQIEKQYYRNLCDSIVESVKMFSISKKQLSRRIKVNWNCINDVNGNVVAMMSHQFNWEWSTQFCNTNINKQFVGIYLPLKSAVFEKIMVKIRSRFGSLVIPVDDMKTLLADLEKQKITWGFIADQSPANTHRCVWVNFFHRKTAFMKGAEIVARRYNNVVIFGEIVRLKRGYYEIKLKLTFENPRQTADGEITEAYVRFLEDSIKRQPDNWVWSHRRWKHVFTEN